MNKHTPGPWTAIATGWATNPHAVWVKKKGVHSVAVANLPDRATISEAEREANARLISAAPDLLDALQTMPQGLSSTDEEWWAWIDKARTAIDKATGEIA